MPSPLYSLNNPVRKFFSQNSKKSRVTQLVVSLAVLVLLVTVSTLPFNKGLYSMLFQRPFSNAAPITSPVTPPVTSPTTPPTPTPAATVDIIDFAFQPSSITITAGQTVTWINTSASHTHTVTSDSGIWDSGPLTPGQSFSFTFAIPGVYTYHCSIHTTMTGTVTVMAATPAPSASPIPGDINGDGSVNLTDLSILAANYGLTNPNIIDPAADLNKDGQVNLTDLSILAANYGT